MSLNLITATIRDMREFLAAKKSKREPLRWSVKGAAQASYRPADTNAFLGFRERLRQSRDFARESERIDSLERDLRKRDAALPVPNELVHNEDRSITLHYAGVTVRAFPDGVGSLIGGTAGQFTRGVKRELLEALAIISRSRLQ
jgi:hypothetical protein